MDNFLNGIAMYRLVLYALIATAIFAIAFAYLGVLPFDGTWLIASLLTLVAACVVSNRIIASLLKVPANAESDFITGLILFFVMTPAANSQSLAFLAVVGATAMATKYVLVWNRRHLFNPAAAGAAIAGFTGLGSSGWWVALPALIPISCFLGLLVVRKMRRFKMFFAFAGAGLASMATFQTLNGTLPDDWLISVPIQASAVWPLVFFGTIMLTEPLTTPPTGKSRLAYGALVGILFGAPVHLGPFYLTSELALLAGNAFSYLMSFKRRIIFMLREKRKLAPSLYEFIFSPDNPFSFTPGQYLEWTLPQKVPDSRGNRRCFTLASSPTENDVRIGVKIPASGSSFKKALLALEPGAKLAGGSLGGEFTLPSETRRKLAFIAGGIGITPFRSMVKYLLDMKEWRDITLFYVCADESEFVYREIFAEAENIGLKTVYIVSGAAAPPAWDGRTGFINEAVLQEEAADYREHTFYLSGPPGMVSSYARLLRSLGIPCSRIKTDYFFGY